MDDTQSAADEGERERGLAVVLAAWNAAARNWDSRALAALYADDALFFGGRPGHAVGKQAIAEYFASYDGTIAAATLELIDQHIAPLGERDFVAQGFGRFRFGLCDGRTTTSLLRTTLVIVWQHGGWKIRLHHFSTVPEVPPLGEG